MRNVGEASTVVSALAVSSITFLLVKFQVSFRGIDAGLPLILSSGVMAYLVAHKVVSFSNTREIYGKRSEELENEISRIVSEIVKIAAESRNPSLEQFATGGPITVEALRLVGRKARDS